MLFIIWMMIEEMKLLFKLKMKYLKEFWSLMNIGIIVCSWTNLGILISKYFQWNEIGKIFEKSGGYAYINIQTIVYLNDISIYLFSFCCFFGTIKFVRLLRFNRRLFYFIQTLQHSQKDLISFSMMFSIVFISFVSLFYLLFHSQLLTCSSVTETTQMLFEMTLMKFDANQLRQAAPVLGPLSFSLFIFIVVFICMSMFLTIINDSFRSVRDNQKDKTKTDDQIFGFMWMKFQRWTRLERRDEIDRFIERDEQMRSKYVDPIENFPEKMDQLLGALNKVGLVFHCMVTVICLSRFTWIKLMINKDMREEQQLPLEKRDVRIHLT